MPKPYSVDLREKVIQAVEDGVSIPEAAVRFSVSQKVIYNWQHLKNNTNSLEPKKGYQKGHSHSIPDLDLFAEFAKKHTTLNVPQIAAEWKKKHGVKVGREAVRLSLKKIGFTFKKKPLGIKKQTQKSAMNI